MALYHIDDDILMIYNADVMSAVTPSQIHHKGGETMLDLDSTFYTAKEIAFLMRTDRTAAKSLIQQLKQFELARGLESPKNKIYASVFFEVFGSMVG